MIAVIGIIFTIATSGGIVVGNARGARPHRDFFWLVAPHVRVAGDVPAPLEASARAAYDRLRELGAPLAGYQVGGGPRAMRGEIVLTTIDDYAFPGHAGQTVSTVDENLGFAVYAVSEVPRRFRGEQGTLVVEHELLHALGYEDVIRSGHVLAFQTSRLGEDTTRIGWAK